MIAGVLVQNRPQPGSFHHSDHDGFFGQFVSPDRAAVGIVQGVDGFPALTVADHEASAENQDPRQLRHTGRLIREMGKDAVAHDPIEHGILEGWRQRIGLDKAGPSPSTRIPVNSHAQHPERHIHRHDMSCMPVVRSKQWKKNARAAAHIQDPRFPRNVQPRHQRGQPLRMARTHHGIPFFRSLVEKVPNPPVHPAVSTRFHGNPFFFGDSAVQIANSSDEATTMAAPAGKSHA